MNNILVPIKKSYLELDTNKQYDLIRELVQEIFNYQGDDNRFGAEKGIAITKEDGERIKYQSLILYFDHNKRDTFKMSLDNESVKIFKTDNGGEISNIIFATISNNKFVILNSEEILREGEYEKIGEWAFKKGNSNNDIEESDSNHDIYIDSQTKDFLEWQVDSGEWDK